MRYKTDIAGRIKESDKKVVEAAIQIGEIAATLHLTFAEFERAVEVAKNSAVMATRD